ncbi:nicotinate-nucleotide--dimethylbenzimidazole phosphoribosyltransferase [Kitasatospora hibisci]|uniref:nicotinate-nucleotide--dimethylbenzimidazole phosphoribosyltransferase n=1 Tax=Kitasatospora hibisci TaxID=3369522 RepID=UPI003754FB6D
MTDGGHVPNEGLPEHLLAGPDPLGGPGGLAAVAPAQGVVPVQGAAVDGGVVPNPAMPDPAMQNPVMQNPVMQNPGVPGGGLIGGVPPQDFQSHGQPIGVPGQFAPAPGLPGAGVAGVPGEGWAVDPGASRPAFHFLDQPDDDQPDPLDDEDDVLLMPGPQGSWGEPAGAPADQSAEQGLPGTPVEPSWPPLDPSALGADQAAQPVPGQPMPGQPVPGQPMVQPLQTQGHGIQVPVQPQGQDPLTAAQPQRRPLHAGPPVPDPSLMTGQVPVRSLADRGPSLGGTPAHGIPVVVGQPEQQAAVPVQAQPVPVAQPVAVEQPVQDVPQAPQPVEGVQGVQSVATEAVPVAEAPVTAEAVAMQAQPVPVAQPVDVEQVAVAAEAVAMQTEPVAVDVSAAPVEAAPVEAVPVEAVPVDVQGAPAAAQEAPAEAAAQAGQPRRIAAFLAAPTPHGLPQVEATDQVRSGEDAVVEQSVPIAPVAQPEGVTAEAAQPAEAAPDDPSAHPAPGAEPVDAAVVEQPAGQPEALPEAAAATAVGTGEMPSGQVVAGAEAEQAQPAPADAAVPAPVTAETVETTEPAGQPEAAAGDPAVAPEPASAAETGAEPAAETGAEARPEAVPADQAPDTAAPVEPSATGAAAGEPATTVEEATAAEATAAEATGAEAGSDAPAGEPAAEEALAGDAAAEEPAEPRGPAAVGFDEAGREAVHQVIRERRDIRNGFRPDPIPHEVLIRVLEAAHTAPSVGFSQPWDFVVIRSAKTRRKMHELAERQREAYADTLPKGRAKQFKEIKIEAILETPVNIVVTADRTRGGRHTLGRHTQPQMAPYSAALAVENLWLAARAEGLGVGWVSFFDEDEMVRELGLPEHLEVVAYLCVGYVDAFPDEPELQQQGWAKKRPLSWVVHEEQYGNRALPGEEPHSLLAETLRGIRPLDAKALGEAWDRQKRMTKPAGSLGMLEIISAQLSGLSRKCPPPIPEPACVAIFAGDHGVHAQGVTSWPQEVTAQMVGNFLAGGAVVNSFAKQIGTEVCVVDVGVAAELPDAIQQGRTTGLLPRKVRPGTGDMTQGPAMTREEALKAIEVGIETARDLVAAGNKALVTGDMGIANTTASAALISVFTGLDPAEVTGRGTGIDDETHARKIEVIRAALALHQPDPADPIGVLAAVGGLEHAAIAGFLLGAASLRTPVILDGVIAGSAALAAKAIAPEVLAACIAGHRSAEPGHQAALAKLGLRPLIDLDLRLGEGTGALLALPLVQSAARAMHDVATFDSAGVTEKA